MWEIIDLDGTLIGIESRSILRLRLFLWKPFEIRAWLRAKNSSSQDEKIFLQSCVPIHPEHLPYNRHVVAGIRNANARGVGVVLASASSRQLVDSVSTFLGGIDYVLASSHSENLKSTAKLKAILEVVGDSDFRYWGNSRADIVVWKTAKSGCVVYGRAARRIDPKVLATFTRIPDVSIARRYWAFAKLLIAPPRDGRAGT